MSCPFHFANIIYFQLYITYVFNVNGIYHVLKWGKLFIFGDSLNYTYSSNFQFSLDYYSQTPFNYCAIGTVVFFTNSYVKNPIIR